MTTKNGIIAKRDLVLNFSDKSRKIKKNKKGKYEAMEEKLLLWFKQARTANIPISGPILREKAEEIAKKMEIEFAPSNGWIDRMKKRAGLSYNSIKGENKSVDPQEIEEWKKMLPDLITGYHPKDVFNMDECGLFYNLSPDKTYAYKGENCHGGKKNKERLTVLLGANMDGSEKLPILVVGKSKKPRCFQNVKSLPCDYENNKTAWMTITIYEAYLKRLNVKMRRAQRNIIVFVDNCAAHSKDTSNLTNIKVHFLPPNSTAVLQPMDQGVIKVFKQHYRKRLVKWMIEKLDNTGEIGKVNVLQSIHFILSAWELITPSVIANCFHKAGFLEGESTEEYELDIEDDWKTLQRRMDFTASFEEYVSVDDAILPCEVLTVDDICEVTEDEEMSDTEEEYVGIPSFSDAVKGLETFRRFIERVENVPEEIF